MGGILSWQNNSRVDIVAIVVFVLLDDPGVGRFTIIKAMVWTWYY